MSEVANKNVVGKTDYELPWSASAGALRADDKIVLDTGKPIFVHEYADDPKRGKVALSVCKFVGELNGKKYALEVSFVIE